MKTNLSLLVALMSFILVGCGGPRFQTVYDMSPPPDLQGRMCVNQCLDSKAYCERSELQLRIEQKKICLLQEEHRSHAAYEDYLFHQKEKGEKVEKSYQDFFHRYACNHISEGLHSPSCESNYRSCYSNCGGRVTTRTFCVANCDEIETPEGNSGKNK